jgi:ribonuclease VapC
MIAVDTSAVVAIILREPAAKACTEILSKESKIIISAGTVAEANILGAARNFHEELNALITDFGFEIIPVTAATALRIGDIYMRWGKGVHPASLNFGDCFAYDVAKEHNCPLLFVGDDFSKTDILSAL